MGNSKVELTLDEVMEYIREQLSSPLREGEFTIEMYAKKMNVCREKARRDLTKAVDIGICSREKRVVEGHSRFVYRLKS